MSSSSFLEDCRGLIERGHESWTSFFTKWENLAKYEEDLPESCIIEDSASSVKHVGERNKNHTHHSKKRKTTSLVTCKKKKRKCKKIVKKKQTPLKTVSPTNSEHCKDSSTKYEDNITETDVLGISLNSFFRSFLKENRNKFQIFGVLSLTFSCSQKTKSHEFYSDCLPVNNFYDYQFGSNTVLYQNQLSKSLNMISKSTFNSVRNNHSEYDNRSVEYHQEDVVEVRKENFNSHYVLDDLYSTSEFGLKKNLNQSTSEIPSKENLTGRRNYDKMLQTFSHESSESHDWHFNNKSPYCMSRKIIKENFIKRTFPHMNITLDGKKLRNLCLHKRTNSFSLDMENSNLTTPERKPPERKCFSENILQSKRRCPSKLFFDNEQDSESDDQTKNRTPLIRCRNKKLKTPVVPEVLESDSDEYESIIDRVEKP